MGTMSLCSAQSERVELTDIKVKNSRDVTFVDIRTDKPIDFLYYNLKNPPRLVIDFVGTHIYSQEPELLVYDYSNICEIKSILYLGDEESPKIDSLVLKFKPNVAVKIKGDKNRIQLQVREHSVISKANETNEATKIRANLLAGRIAESKRTITDKISNQDVIVTADAYSPASDFIVASSVKKINSPGSYVWSLYEASIKEKMHEFAVLDKIALADESSKQEGVSKSKERLSFAGLNKEEKIESMSVFNFQTMRFGFNILLVSSLVFLAGYKLRQHINAISHQRQLPDVNEILSNVRSRPIDIYNFNNMQGDADNNLLEKRRYARFDLPQDDHISVYLDIETEGFEKIKTRAQDISLGGIRIEIDSRTRLPEVLELELRLPDYEKASDVLARIEWVNPIDDNSCMYGLSFMMLGENEENKIRDFLNNNF
jgi:hypothetical protein